MYGTFVSSVGARDSKLDAEVKLLRTSGHSVGRVGGLNLNIYN